METPNVDDDLQLDLVQDHLPYVGQWYYSEWTVVCDFSQVTEFSQSPRCFCCINNYFLEEFFVVKNWGYILR